MWPLMWPLVQSETDIAYYGQNFLTKKKSQFQFLWVEDILTPLGKISIILWLSKPLQRTIEILPLGVTDFAILYSCGVRFYISNCINPITFVGWFMVFNATFNNISVILWWFIAFVKIKSFNEDLFFLLVIKSIYNL